VTEGELAKSPDYSNIVPILNIILMQPN